jgi:hypothetical protein
MQPLPYEIDTLEPEDAGEKSSRPKRTSSLEE